LLYYTHLFFVVAINITIILHRSGDDKASEGAEGGKRSVADEATDSPPKYDEPGRRGSAANFFFSTLIEGPPVLPPPDDGPPTDPEGNSQPPPESPEGTALPPPNNGVTDVWPLPDDCPPANPEGYSRTLPEAGGNMPPMNHPGQNAHLEGGDARHQPANLESDDRPQPDHPERNHVCPPPNNCPPTDPEGYSPMLPEAGDNRPPTNHPGHNAHLEGGDACPQPANLKGNALPQPDHPERKHVWPPSGDCLPANPGGYSRTLPEAGDKRPPTNHPDRNAHLEGGDARPQPANLEGNACPPPNDEPPSHPEHNARPPTKSGFKSRANVQLPS
jgi:hypothetical protein